MIKLSEAKCPSCGANIQVNEKLENTICQYCGTQVLVEDAIEKYKIEISGKIEVDGIETRKSRLERAKKHIDLKEIKDASGILYPLYNEDKLDVDVLVELVRMKVVALEMDGFDTDFESDNICYKAAEEMIDYRDRIIKLSGNDDALSDFKDRVEKLEQIYNQDKLEKDNLNCLSYRFNLLLIQHNLDDKQLQFVTDTINKYLNTSISPETVEKINGNYIHYRISEIKGLSKKGDLTINFNKINDVDKANPFSMDKIYPAINDIYDDETLANLGPKDHAIENYNDVVKAVLAIEADVIAYLANNKNSSGGGLFKLFSKKSNDNSNDSFDAICNEIRALEEKHRNMELGDDKLDAANDLYDKYDEFYQARFNIYI